MADQWRQQSPKEFDGWNGRNSVQAAIAFAFFSILVWVKYSFVWNSIFLMRTFFFRADWYFSHSVDIEKAFRIYSAQVMKIIQLVVDKPMEAIHQQEARVVFLNHHLLLPNKRNRIINHQHIRCCFSFFLSVCVSLVGYKEEWSMFVVNV